MKTINDFERLKHLLLRKWASNKSFMSENEFEHFIDFKLHHENYQEKLITRIELYENLKHKQILDIGSGEGGLVVALCLRGYRALGIDIKDANIEISQLRAKLYNLSSDIFFKADAKKLPFNSNHFDVIIMNEILEHVSDIGTTLKEVSRILKPGGLFFATVPNALWPFEGHVNLWFPHWFPLSLRKLYVRVVRKEKGLESNYLDNIRYHGHLGWCRIVQPYFKLSLSSIVIYKKIFSDKEGLFWRIMEMGASRESLFRCIEFLSPITYLISRK